MRRHQRAPRSEHTGAIARPRLEPQLGERRIFVGRDARCDAAAQLERGAFVDRVTSVADSEVFRRHALPSRTHLGEHFDDRARVAALHVVVDREIGGDCRDPQVVVTR